MAPLGIKDRLLGRSNPWCNAVSKKQRHCGWPFYPGTSNSFCIYDFHHNHYGCHGNWRSKLTLPMSNGLWHTIPQSCALICGCNAVRSLTLVLRTCMKLPILRKMKLKNTETARASFSNCHYLLHVGFACFCEISFITGEKTEKVHRMNSRAPWESNRATLHVKTLTKTV